MEGVASITVGEAALTAVEGVALTTAEWAALMIIVRRPTQIPWTVHLKAGTDMKADMEIREQIVITMRNLMGKMVKINMATFKKVRKTLIAT